MPKLIVTTTAGRGLERCRKFLDGKNRLAARRASETILGQLRLLRQHPEIGRPRSDHPDLRELFIPFGDGGYVALYRHVPEEDSVVLLAFRHQKEAGY